MEVQQASRSPENLIAEIQSDSGHLMHIFFADDSEQRSPIRNGLEHLVGYGGALFPEHTLDPYAKFLETLRETLGLPAATEFKWSPGKDSPLFRKNEVQRRAREEMLDAAIDMGIRSVVVITDIVRIPAWTKTDAEREMLKYLYERISGALKDVDDIGMIIADEPGGGGERERQWLADSLKLTSQGTEYVSADRIVLPVATTDSKHFQHLQLADLVVAASTSAVSGSPYALSYAKKLRRLAHKNWAGFAGGTGIKLCPDHPNNFRSIINLHYWVFQEHEYWKVGRNVGLPLPYSYWAFSETDGL